MHYQAHVNPILSMAKCTIKHTNPQKPISTKSEPFIFALHFSMVMYNIDGF